MAAYSTHRILTCLRDGDIATNTTAKGRALEDLVCYLFDKIPGITISHRNSFNAFLTEEIDVAFWNERNRNGLQFLPYIILVECKNWSKPVSSIEVNWFASKVENRGLDFGILIACTGITGDRDDLTRAHHVISTHLAKQRKIVIITRKEIEQLLRSEELITLIKMKLCELAVSGTIM